MAAFGFVQHNFFILSHIADKDGESPWGRQAETKCGLGFAVLGCQVCGVKPLWTA